MRKRRLIQLQKFDRKRIFAQEQAQKEQKVPNKMNTKCPMSRHITIKMAKVKYKERILKATKEKELKRKSHNVIS